MEDVKRNIATFLQILQMGESESVSHWNESNFKRAQQWARYAEEVYKKLESEPSFVQVLTSHVNQAQRSENKDKTPAFQFKDLQFATEKLRVILLRNTHLSSAQFSFVLEMYGVDFFALSRNNLKTLISDSFKISCSKGTFCILSAIRDEVSKKFEISRESTCNTLKSGKHLENYSLASVKCELHTTADVCADVCGKLLWKNLQNSMEKQKEGSLGEHSITRKLKSIACEETGVEVILRMLVDPMEGEKPASFSINGITLDSLKHHVLCWILECIQNDPGYSEKLMSCPSSLLCRVSSLSMPFNQTYLKVLKSRGDGLLERPSTNVSQDGGSYGSGYRDLVDRLHELCHGPKHTSDFSKQILRSWSLDSPSSFGTENSEISANFWKRVYHQICQ